MNERIAEKPTKKNQASEAIVAVLAAIGFVVATTVVILCVYRKFKSSLSKFNISSPFGDVDNDIDE